MKEDGRLFSSTTPTRSDLSAFGLLGKSCHCFTCARRPAVANGSQMLSILGVCFW